MRLMPVRTATPLANAAGNTTAEPASSVLPTAPTTNIEPKLLVVPDEEAVLAAVRDGRAQVGITYSTLAVADKHIRILSPLPISTYAVPSYNAAIPRNAPNYEEAYRFLNFLRSNEARDAMQRRGLLVY
jgi:ABC-type molybdate transport system substrate-binding protein